MLADKAMRVSRRIELRRPKNEDGALEARVIDCFPAIALFIFVAYHGLRDFIASTIGMYGAVVYTLTGLSYLLLIVYWFRCGLRLSGRVILPAVAVFAIFSIYVVLCDVDYFIFDDYALPQAINPMGGMIAFLFLASQNDAKRADAALKFASIVMTLYLQASLGSVMQATTLYGYDMGLGFDAMFFALLSLHFIVDDADGLNIPSFILWLVCALSNIALILSYGSRGPLLGIIAFAALRFLVFVFGSKTSVIKKFLISAAILCAALILVFSLTDLALALNHQLNSMGITSRTLEKFLYADVMSDSGRSAIWNALTPRISLFGNGPFSDQAYLGPATIATTSSSRSFMTLVFRSELSFCASSPGSSSSHLGAATCPPGSPSSLLFWRFASGASDSPALSGRKPISGGCSRLWGFVPPTSKRMQPPLRRRLLADGIQTIQRCPKHRLGSH